MVTAPAVFEDRFFPAEPGADTQAGRIRLLVEAGIREELAIIHVLGRPCTSREIASAIVGPAVAPERGQVMSVGRRLHGLENRGQAARWGDEWHLTQRSIDEIERVEAGQ